MLQSGFCVIFGRGGKLFGCFEGNFENTGRMEMFSIPGESDLVESFMFGQGQIQIPSQTCLFYSKNVLPTSKKVARYQRPLEEDKLVFFLTLLFYILFDFE